MLVNINDKWKVKKNFGVVAIFVVNGLYLKKGNIIFPRTCNFIVVARCIVRK